MNRVPKRQRTQLRGFHSDWVPFEEDEDVDYHAREGSVTRKGNHNRLSLLRREPDRALGADSWMTAEFWSTPDSTEFALDINSTLYDQALDSNVMDDLPEASLPDGAEKKKKKRKKNSRISVRPHVIWKEQYRQVYLDELIRWSGRGEFQNARHCSDCVARAKSTPGSPEYRCRECLTPDLLCDSCCVKRHRNSPFHRIQKWDGSKFLDVSLKSLGYKLQLNHTSSFCANPVPAHKDLLIIHTNGIHDVPILYCGCSRALPLNIQLLRRQLYPASHIKVRTCASFQLLDHLHKFALATKASTYDFYRALEKLTSNTGINVPKSRYRPLSRMTLQWRHLKMLKWAGRANDPSGVNGTKTGELAIRCPSCPHPDINLPKDWANTSEKLKFLFMMIVCMDANFRLKNQIVSNYSQDPGLGIGWAYLVPRQPYEAYVLSRASDDDISTCVGFQALAKANSKFSVGLRYTGVGAVVCGRSEMILPSGVGNLQKGERYANMDYIFGSALQYVLVLLVLVSYDIACQWFSNLFVRINGHWPDSIKPHQNMSLTPAIPKLHEPMHKQQDHQVFSLNFIKGVGMSDCECPERVWAPHNPLSNSTKTQGPGSRQDVLDDHFGFWNWLKYIGMGATLLRRYKAAVALRNLQEEGHRGLTATLDAAQVKGWQKMCEDWEADGFPKRVQNPYHLEDAYMSEAQVKKELADEEEKRLADGGSALHETSAAGFVQMGLDLEEAQRRLKRLQSTIASKVSTTLGDKRSLTEERNNFRVRQRAWEKLLPIYMPGLLHYQTTTPSTSSPLQFPAEQNTHQVNAKEKPFQPEDVVIWLPSQIPAHARKQVCIKGLPEIEERLRDAQCMDSLRKLRRILQVKSRMIYFKNKNLRGQRDGTRSRSIIDHVHLKARNAADRYRACRAAKLSLTGPGKWEDTFRILNNEDIRGYQDPNRLRPRTGRPGTVEDDGLPGSSDTPEAESEDFDLFNDVRTRRDGTGETRRTLSWIWLTTPSDDNEDKDGVLRVEWAKSLARSTRAREEVMLLKEEMRRVLAFLEWKSLWWREQQDKRVGLDPDIREGVRAFALRQSDLQSRLALRFRDLWKAPLEEPVAHTEDKSASKDTGNEVALTCTTGDTDHIPLASSNDANANTVADADAAPHSTVHADIHTHVINNSGNRNDQDSEQIGDGEDDEDGEDEDEDDIGLSDDEEGDKWETQSFESEDDEN